MGLRFEGHAIVSGDGMLADAGGVQPPELIVAADQRFFKNSLDRSDLIVHGRNSFENQPNSPERKRVIATRRVQSPMRDSRNPNAVLWNPDYAAIEEAAALAGVTSGDVAVIGGTEIFDMFLDRYDVFWLSQAPRVTLPGGVPIFREVPARSAQQILHAHGLTPRQKQMLDAERDISVVEWVRS